MTANEAKAVLLMSESQLIGKDLVDSALVPNLTSQRDNSLNAETVAVTEKAALAESHKKELDDLKATHAEALQAVSGTVDARTASLKTANEQVAALTAALAEEVVKRETMEGHPDVVAKRKADAVTKAEADKLAAIAMKEQAEKALADLGMV